MSDFKADVLALYQKAGLKGEGLVFLFTDQQCVSRSRSRNLWVVASPCPFLNGLSC